MTTTVVVGIIGTVIVVLALLAVLNDEVESRKPPSHPWLDEPPPR